MDDKTKIFDVIVVGGGPIGWATAYEVAKSGASVMLLEQNTFFNQAGSSGDMARMFRTMYTEDYMANLAFEALGVWDELEKDAGVSLRSMSGLLNFGDKDFDDGSPEGTLLGPINNLERLNMEYKELTAEQIEKRYPFKNLPKSWIGIFAPDNGVINVQLLLRTLSRLAKDYGARAQQYTTVHSLEPHEDGWIVKGFGSKEQAIQYRGRKIVLTCGAYINNVLDRSFGFQFDLNIWEMVASYWSVNPGPSGTVFPSMWFQFAPDKMGPDGTQRSQLLYGFPALEWGPPNMARIAVDAATQQISDPSERKTNVVNPDDIRDVQDFIKEHVDGVDATVPAYSLSCLQTNVFDNMFVLDYVPEKYLRGGAKNSVAVFTAGWAMKFVPLLGKALKDMVLHGHSDYERSEFSMTRRSKDGKRGVIVEDMKDKQAPSAQESVQMEQAKGSSIKCEHSVDPVEVAA